MSAAIVSAPTTQSQTRPFVIAWAICLLFYFLEYAIRSAPAVMIPELSRNFGVTATGVSGILGVYYYTYSTTSLIAGALLDRFGAKYVLFGGVAVLGAGCLIFTLPSPLMGDIGRLLQGAGSAFAFTGAVYLASHGLPAERLATAIGLTQCLGMLGGSAGQFVVGPLIHGPLSTTAFWTMIGLVVLGVGVLLLLATPKESRTGSGVASMLSNYKIVFSNPQSYLCGLIAGLLFAPTTILDMVWGVRFLEQDDLFSYRNAVVSASMVPLGWVFGCPLLGWFADRLGRRKPALALGAGLMVLCILQLTYQPLGVPTWLTLFIFGVASGAAMIPYTIIKEVNPDRVKGSATGGMNFLTFAVTAALGPIFATHYGLTLGSTHDHSAHLRQTNLFWIVLVVVAILLTLALRETGAAVAKSQVRASS